MGTFRYIGTPALIARGQGAIRAAVVESAEDLVGKASGQPLVISSGTATFSPRPATSLRLDPLVSCFGRGFRPQGQMAALRVNKGTDG